MTWVHYLPILTTLLSIYFLWQIVPHTVARKHVKYLVWWTLGVFTYGLGTLSESINTLFGMFDVNVTFWYIVGALLGGWPLAQGTAYLLIKERWADVFALVIGLVVLIATVCVIASPVDLSMAADGRLTGKVFTWEWVRLFSPWVNIYAFVFLFGGAIYSAIRYYSETENRVRFVGNIWIAIGALLPGIGGSMTRMGYVEALYVTELLGLICIYIGYMKIKGDRRTSVHRNQVTKEATA